jgi:hypothetical protein
MLNFVKKITLGQFISTIVAVILYNVTGIGGIFFPKEDSFSKIQEYTKTTAIQTNGCKDLKLLHNSNSYDDFDLPEDLLAKVKVDNLNGQVSKQTLYTHNGVTGMMGFKLLEAECQSLPFHKMLANSISLANYDSLKFEPKTSESGVLYFSFINTTNKDLVLITDYKTNGYDYNRSTIIIDKNSSISHIVVGDLSNYRVYEVPD